MEPTKVELDIMEAAKTLFMEKGFAATSTTDIARKAGCNQALVHYYYRTKDNLFEKIYLEEANSLLSMVSRVLDEPMTVSLEQLISNTIDMYFHTLHNNPNAPFFLVQEMLLNADRREMIRRQFIHNALRQEAYGKYQRFVYQLVEQGKMRAIEPFDLLINVVSLVASTFLSLPLYAHLLEKTPEEQETYLIGRKEEIKKMLVSRLVPS